ncbi:hypothetical protein BD626DRAFT_365356, partial [Schizophyllum amplum]
AGRKSLSNALAQHDLGYMDDACPSCGALHWTVERLSSSTQAKVLFGLCCDSGQVLLPYLQPPPPLLRLLFDNDDSRSRAFRKNIRQYNNAFAFTSLGVDHDRRLNATGRSAWVFRIHGELHHWSSALERSDGGHPVFAQVYIYDASRAHAHRVANNDNLDAALLLQLEHTLRECNPYALIYEHAYRVLAAENVSDDATIRLRVTPGTDPRRYNLPTADEVAMILPGDGGTSAAQGRDIVLRRRASEGRGNLFRISELHAAYAPLQFVLLFPRGESGWHEHLTLR